MFNIFFKYYLKQEEYTMLTNLSANQIKKIWNNENISLKNKLKITFQNEHYEIFSTLDEKVMDKMLKNQEELNLTDEQIIKILCQKEDYEKIGYFLKTLDEIRTSSFLNEEEIVLSGLACIHFSQQKLDEFNRIGLDNLTREMKIERYELERFIANAKNVVRKKANGIKKLFEEHHPFFEEVFSKIVNFNFLNFYVDDDLVSFLYNRGYDQLIKKNLFEFHRPIICDLFSHEEIKKELISRELLIQKMDIPEIYNNLPIHQKGLIAYFGCVFFESQKYLPIYRQEAQKNLKELFANNFNGILSEEMQQEIMKLYGMVPSYAIEVLIDKVMLDSSHLKKIDSISSKYFNEKKELGFILDAKYPTIVNQLFLLKIESTDMLRNKLIYLCQKPVLENINTLEDIVHVNLDDLKIFHYSIQNQKNKKAVYEKISPDNIARVQLFLYQNEILIINLDGVVFEYNVPYAHSETLFSAYCEIIDVEGKNEQEILYEANMMGDAIFVIENAGVILYLPPTISSNQKMQLLEKIKHLENHERRNEIVLNGGFAIPNTKCEYVYFNDGEQMSILELMDEICKLKVDDKGKILHSKVTKRNKK